MSRRAAALLLLAAGALTACYEERGRPGPPQLSVTLDQLEVESPDTLGGYVRASDPDGVDSLWLTVDTLRYGIEGFLLEDVEGRFVVPIGAGLSPGSPVPLRFEARDLLGFVATLDTFVKVAFPGSANVK